MAGVETGLQSSLKSHKMLKCFINGPALKNKKTSSAPYVSLKKISAGKGAGNRLTFSKKAPHHKSAQGDSQNYTALYVDIYSQVNHSISLIEDPLWKRVCTEIVNVIGPHSVLEICNSQLGPISPQDKVIDLYCDTEDIARLVEQCSCVILGSLHQYFPALKELRVRNELFAFEL